MSNATVAKVRVFNTQPQSEIPVESPLAWSYKHVGVPAPTDNSGVIMRERPFLGHIILRGDARQMDDALRKVLDLPLAVKPLQLICDEARGLSVQWYSPDEWLLIVPAGEEFTIENQLRDALGDAHFSIVNVTGGQTLVELEGKNVRELLMKSVVYDVHPKNFPVGKAVSTVFAKTLMAIRRPSEHRWQLVFRRSFADYCYRWLLDAGNEYHIGVKR